jgi:FlaA1/EpsC-like NDP-sugar epimerase
VALAFATVVRWNFAVSDIDYEGLGLIIPLAVLAQVVGGLASGLYTGRWRFGSFEEVAGLARAAAMTTVLLFVVDIWVITGARMIPLSATIAGGVFALALMGGARYLWRLGLERRRRPVGETLSRLLVFGAGEGGAQVIQAVLRDPGSPYLPVALLDDDVRKANLQVMGIPVVGTRQHLEMAAKRLEADTLLIAIPSASAELVGELTDVATDAGLAVKVLPPVAELFDGGIGVGDIRDVSVVDLLGRHEVHTDLESIAGYLTGKRVLVTGAGGSIGSELCRQIYRFAPSDLIMVDRDESALHAVQLSIEGRAMLDSPSLVLLDIRDTETVERLFAERQPEVVFHAAALKHLPLLERHPEEAVKTNVWGTLSLLGVAMSHGVERFVNVSTDKAADPCSVLGYSKRITERLTAYFAEQSSGVYLSVRFGNVLGSRGSVLETFRSQLEAGGPLTVTDPDVTRYFMTVEEAVQLVVQAGAIGRSGEALVLDMGEPVRITEVASRLAGMSNRPIEITYTGLRRGEKLREVLLGQDEADERPVHPAISHVPVPPLDPELAWALDAFGATNIVRALRDLCQDRALRAPE